MVFDGERVDIRSPLIVTAVHYQPVDNRNAVTICHLAKGFLQLHFF
ncbi:Uncharacterised protein [Escherichia coli]|nr:Uncharacterised protein [Escherichia coli]